MNFQLDPLERPDSLKDRAYRELKGLLTNGSLERDEIYSANQFAGILGVSRTPVREALLQLASEGFLVFVEGRGFRVKRHSEKEIRDFFEARRVIESYIAEQLVSQIGAKELGELEQTLKAMRHLAAKKDRHAFLDADKDFHMALARRHSNTLFESVIESIRNHIAIIGLRSVAYQGRFEQIIAEHGEIIRALRDRNKKAVVQAVLDHLVTSERYVLGRAQAV